MRALKKSKTPEGKQYKKLWNKKNPEKLRSYGKTWRQNNPDYDWNKKNPERAKARYKRHEKTPARKAYRKKWSQNKYATNPEFREKVLAQNADWREKNPRSGAGYTIEEQFAMNQRRKMDKNQCQWQVLDANTKKSRICGIKHSRSNSIHVNHIFSRSKYPELRANPKYMICYCVEHHSLWHFAKKDSFAVWIKSKIGRAHV